MQAQFNSILDAAENEVEASIATALAVDGRETYSGGLGRPDAGAAPRVLMVVESSAAGTGRHVLDLSEALIGRGFEVHLIWSNRRVDRLFLDRLEQLPGLRHAPVPMWTNLHPHDLAALWAVRRYLRNHGPFNLIHGHSSKGGALARLAAVGTGIPVVYTPHGIIMMDPDLSRWKRLFFQAIEVGLSLGTHRIIAVSPEEQRVTVRAGLGQSRVIMVPNGVGDSRLVPRCDARRAIGVGEDDILFGFVGRLVPQKGPDVLLEAFAIAARAEPRARLAMIGAGPLEEAMHKLARRLGVESAVLWLGERDARAILASFDVFALASRKEGLPYVVLEAMAAGLPVVATETAGVEILVESGKNGLVVPRDDVAAFAGAMIRLATDPVLRDRFGRASLQRASRFTIDVMAERTLQAYRDVWSPESPADSDADESIAPS